MCLDLLVILFCICFVAAPIFWIIVGTLKEKDQPMTIGDFCQKYCDNCGYFTDKEMHCAVDSEPSCALSREMGIKITEEDHL